LTGFDLWFVGKGREGLCVDKILHMPMTVSRCVWSNMSSQYPVNL